MEAIVVQPMRWSEIPDVKAVTPLNEGDRTVLAALHAVLREHDCVDRFGIFLIHKHFDVHDGEVVVEYTNREKREQITVVETAQLGETQANGKVIETAWKFDRESPVAVTVCELFCHYDNGHRLRHRRVAR